MSQEQKLAIIGGTLGVIVLMCVAAFALATFFMRNTGDQVAIGAGPQVLMKSPQQGAKVPVNQDLPVQVSASDTNGIIRVELYVNGSQVASESSPNLQGLQSFSPTLTWRPTTPGSYSLQARAVNRNNVTGESTVIQVTAQPDVTPPPTATTTPSPTNTSTQAAPSPTPIVIVVTATPTPLPPTPTNTNAPPSPTATTVPPTTTPLPPTATPLPPTATNTTASPAATQVVKQVAVNGNDNGQVVAACPNGTKVTGGGFDGDVSFTISASVIQGNGWQVQAKNNSRSSRQLTARAICVSGIGGAVSQSTAQATVQPSATATATAGCPAGSTLTGGGFGSNAQQTVYVSANSGNGWQAASRNISTNPQTLNVSAICYGGPGASSTVVSKQSDISGNGNASVTADCPSDKIVTGGGFGATTGLAVTDSSKNGNSWQVSAANALTTTQTLTTVAVCTGF